MGIESQEKLCHTPRQPNGCHPSSLEGNLLVAYNNLLVEKNKVMNLTAHRTHEQSWLMNIQDSLLFNEEVKGFFINATPLPLTGTPLISCRFKDNYSNVAIATGGSQGENLKRPNVLDIGSGGGCPGIPLAITFPDAGFTLVDSIGKKVKFLNEAIAELGLTNAKAIQARVETLEKNVYDVVIARALAPLPLLLEYAMPRLKKGGVLIAFKGRNADEEIKVAGVKPVADYSKVLDGDVVRRCLVFKKG